MVERRKGDDRRSENSRGIERRMGDRRDSHRVPLEIEVREGNGPYEKHSGNMAIGGVFFKKPLQLPIGAIVQLRFVLPGSDRQILTKAELMEISKVGMVGEMGTRVRFIDLDIKSELSIAKYLDDNVD